MNKNLLIGAILLLLLSIISVYIFTAPAQSWSKALTLETANIATSISGFTAPILTAISIGFLYIAFSEQKRTNDIQKRKNNFEKVMQLFEHAQSNFIKFEYILESHDIAYKGHEASDRLISLIGRDERITFEAFTRNLKTFEMQYIFQSFTILRNAIINSDLETDNRAEIIILYNSFYNSFLRTPLNVILGKFQQNDTHELIRIVNQLRPIAINSN